MGIFHKHIPAFKELRLKLDSQQILPYDFEVPGKIGKGSFTGTVSPNLIIPL